MNNKLFIPVILGTNRDGRKSKNVANFIIDEINKRDDIDTELVDVSDFNFAHDKYGGDFPEYKELIVSSDGIIIVTPEYNHGYPGVLKELLDTLFDEYKNKAVGLVGVSSGDFGGGRGIENLLPVLRELGLVLIQKDLYFPKVSEKFDKNGKIKDEDYYERTTKFIDDIVWLGNLLKIGRNENDV